MTAPRRTAPQRIVTLLIMVVMLAYPLVVYLHIESVSPRWYAFALLVLVGLRFVVLGNTRQLSNWMMLILAAVFCVAVMLLESVTLLTFYPVLMNVGMGLMFITSLADEQSLIEKFARAGGKQPPEAARGYLRALSLSWGVLLLLNGVASAYTAWFTSLSVWALYNGLISYLVMGGFAAIEYAYRGYYKKRHNIVDD